jgi:hypothetical protein
MEYRVMWLIDVEAETPVEAALIAQEIQRDPESIATVFTVVDRENNGARVDLDPALRH